MWLVIDADSLQIVDIRNHKREAVFLYSQNETSKRIAKGLYLLSDNNSLQGYESFLVNERAIDNLIEQGFEWLQIIEMPNKN